MSDSSDEKELQAILKREPAKKSRREQGNKRDVVETTREDERGSFVQWAVSNNKIFVPAQETTSKLFPGLYEIKSSSSTPLYFERVEISTTGLILFPDSNSSRIIQEIETFWDREDKFTKYGVTFKRGILLFGPPGGGKTCTIKLAIVDLIKRNGIVVKFTQPSLTMLGLRSIRDIQPDTPIIVLMEDIDAIIEAYNESEVVNILDGVDCLNKIVFLATTNYPEKLGERIINRPSRFDRRLKIGMPSKEARGILLRKLFELEPNKPDISKWVKETDGFSIAHIKELFVSVVILGAPYENSLELLRSMSSKVSSRSDGRGIGFGA